MSILIFVYLGAAVLGVAVARRPLSRPRYWARLGIFALALGAILFVPALLDYAAPAERAAMGPLVLSILLIGVVVTPVALFLAFLWQGRRMIDAAGSRWWALLGLFPLAFMVFGAMPSRPAESLSQDKAVDVFS